MRRSVLIPLIAVLTVFGALVIAGCGDDDEGGDGTSSGGTGEGGKIAFLLPETQNARYETQDKPNFESSVAELCPDCEVLYQNAEQDAASQQQQVEAAITEGVDVIVLDPVDSTTAGALVDRASDAGIPVVSYDRLILDTENLNSYVAFDSREVGVQQGEALSDQLESDGNPTGPIVKINGDPKDNNAKLFKEGSNQVFSDRGVEIAKEYDTPDWLPENAQREMDQAISALGDDGFTGVYAANDGTAGGAIAALQGAGLDPKTIPVTGQDAELTAIQRILEGTQFMTVYKPVVTLADNAAQIAVALAQGDEAPSDLLNSEEDNGSVSVPTASTDTIPVTVENVNDTVVADGYWTAEQICTPEYEQACSDAGIG